jgi:hypothetical protein
MYPVHPVSVGYSCPISSKVFVNKAETILHEDKTLLQRLFGVSRFNVQHFAGLFGYK